MKRITPLILVIAALSAASGYMLSKASWIGRVGMSLFYRQYSFLKIWWQGALAVFAVLIVLLIVQAIVHNKASKGISGIVHIIALLIAIGGLYATYHDFMHDFSHRLLKERFHIGAYLFWVGWMLISLFFLFSKKTTEINNKAASGQ